MSKASSKRSSKAPAKKAKPAKKTAPAVDSKKMAKLFSDAQADGYSSFATSEAPNAARHGFASHDRTDGKSEMSSKRTIFEHAVKLLTSGKACDVKTLQAFAVAKKLKSMKTGKPVKPSTIAAWFSNWCQLSPKAFYPCEIARKTEINKLFGKLVAKKS